MFYIFFALTILLSLFAIWVGANLYAIFYLSHRAEVLLGRIMVLLQKRQELLKKFLNDIFVENDDEKRVVYEIREMSKEVEQERALPKRVSIELSIDERLNQFKERISEKGAAFQTFQQIRELLNEILEQKERFNKVVARLEELYKKRFISDLVRMFHIKRIERL